MTIVVWFLSRDGCTIFMEGSTVYNTPLLRKVNIVSAILEKTVESQEPGNFWECVHSIPQIFNKFLFVITDGESYFMVVDHNFRQTAQVNYS